MRYLKEPSGSPIPSLLWGLAGVLAVVALFFLVRNVILPAVRTPKGDSSTAAITPTPVTTPTSAFVVTPTPVPTSSTYPAPRTNPTRRPAPTPTGGIAYGPDGLPQAGPAEDLALATFVLAGSGSSYYALLRYRLRKTATNLDVMD